MSKYANLTSSSTTILHRFGRDPAAGTSFAPVAVGGVYQMPQAASATTVRIKAGGNLNDTAAGSGARKVYIEGLDATGALVNEELTTNGISASTVSSNSYMRLLTAYVSESGSYASATAGSHAASIVIENGTGGTDWLTIDATDYAKGQSELGCYTVPLGKTAYISHIKADSEAANISDIVLFNRNNILDAAAPYQPAQIQLTLGGALASHTFNPEVPYGPYPELSDIGFMAKVAAGTGIISVDYEIILV